MNMPRLITVPTLVLAFATLVTAQQIVPTLDNSRNPDPQTVNSDKWHFQLIPYLWVAGINGRAGIGNLAVDVDAAITDPDVDLNFGFMATFEARKNKFVILTDLQYSNIGAERATPGPLFSDARAEFKTFVLDPEVGYRIVDNPEKGAFVDVLGGIRYWHLKSETYLRYRLAHSHHQYKQSGLG